MAPVLKAHRFCFYFDAKHVVLGEPWRAADRGTAGICASELTRSFTDLWMVRAARHSGRTVQWGRTHVPAIGAVTPSCMTHV